MEFNREFELLSVNPRKLKDEDETIMADLVLQGDLSLPFIDKLTRCDPNLADWAWANGNDRQFMKLWGITNDHRNAFRYPCIDYIKLNVDVSRTLQCSQLIFYETKLRKWRLFPRTDGAIARFMMTLEPREHLGWFCDAIGHELVCKVTNPQAGLFDGETEAESATG